MKHVAPTAPTATTEEKAKGRSISFYPASLYCWAQEFGQKQTPKLSPSAVICTALQEFKQRHEPNTDEAQLIAAARKVGVGRAIEAIARLRRPARKPGSAA